jgi:hypothetical protein
MSLSGVLVVGCCSVGADAARSISRRAALHRIRFLDSKRRNAQTEGKRKPDSRGPNEQDETIRFHWRIPRASGPQSSRRGSVNSYDLNQEAREHF